MKAAITPIGREADRPADVAPAHEDLTRLAGILESEADAYEEMLALSSAERSQLVARDLAGLRETVARKEAVIARVDALEVERRAAVLTVAGRLTGPGRAMTVSEILAAVREPDRARLSSLRKRILDEIARIQRINETNAFLIGSSLELIEDELSIMTQGDEIAYDDRGDTSERRQRAPILDRRA